VTVNGRAALLATLTEREWQAQVLAWADRAAWRVYHTADSRRSAAGFPDLVLVKPGYPVIFAELKTVSGRLSLMQRIWLEELGACPGVLVRVWKPSDETAIKAELGLAA
jgi:hypothetical protein